MEGHLVEKTERYEYLLADAVEAAEIVCENDQVTLAEEHVAMAEAYLDDGRHFLEEGDYVTALAAFSYGHGWLDAAIRSDLVDPGDAIASADARGV